MKTIDYNELDIISYNYNKLINAYLMVKFMR